MIDRNGGTEADIKSRIKEAQAAFTSLKLRLFNSNIRSVSLYGSETLNTSLHKHEKTSDIC